MVEEFYRTPDRDGVLEVENNDLRGKGRDDRNELIRGTQDGADAGFPDEGKVRFIKRALKKGKGLTSVVRDQCRIGKGWRSLPPRPIALTLHPLPVLFEKEREASVNPDGKESRKRRVRTPNHSGCITGKRRQSIANLDDAVLDSAGHSQTRGSGSLPAKDVGDGNSKWGFESASRNVQNV